MRFLTLFFFGLVLVFAMVSANPAPPAAGGPAERMNVDLHVSAEENNEKPAPKPKKKCQHS